MQQSLLVAVSSGFALCDTSRIVLAVFLGPCGITDVAPVFALLVQFLEMSYRIFRQAQFLFSQGSKVLLLTRTFKGCPPENTTPRERFRGFHQ